MKRFSKIVILVVFLASFFQVQCKQETTKSIKPTHYEWNYDILGRVISQKRVVPYQYLVAVEYYNYSLYSTKIGPGFSEKTGYLHVEKKPLIVYYITFKHEDLSVGTQLSVRLKFLSFESMPIPDENGSEFNQQITYCLSIFNLGRAYIYK